MNSRFTTNLSKAALLLHTILADTDRLDVVLRLQQHLIRQITRLERRSKRIQRAAANMRATLKTQKPTRDLAKALKKRIKDCPGLLEKIRWEMFIWRCFGDGIAFAYQSKHALKHLYFDRNYQVKPTAGFLTGKTGFKLEWRMLRLGIKMGVPVVLSDLTNVIRHGDVCGLGGPDPLPIEIKSGDGRNKRTDRQFADIKELGHFYENNGAPKFRGMDNVQRVEAHHPEINYLEVINSCITESRTNGFSSVEPEHGLRYIAIHDLTQEKLEEVRHYGGNYTVFTVLTPDESWLPMQPFTLSFETANLIDFICGKVTVVVLIDLIAVKQLFLEHGIHSVFLMDGNHAMQICKNPQDLAEGVFRVSELLFSRIALEFQSLTWFAKEYASFLEPVDLGSISLDEVTNLPGFGRSPPAEWYKARDFFENTEVEHFCSNYNPQKPN